MCIGFHVLHSDFSALWLAFLSLFDYFNSTNYSVQTQLFSRWGHWGSSWLVRGFWGPDLELQMGVLMVQVSFQRAFPLSSQDPNSQWQPCYFLDVKSISTRSRESQHSKDCGGTLVINSFSRRNTYRCRSRMETQVRMIWPRLLGRFLLNLLSLV